jgi:hypothetical protein
VYRADTGELIYDVPQYSYKAYNVVMPGNNTRLFLTGSTHNEGSYPIQWGKVIYHSVDVWTPYSIADNVGTYNPFADHHDVTGVIQYMDFPESGEWLAVAAATTSSPVNGYVHHIYVPASGFSTTYTAQTTGNSYDLKAADGCAFSIDAREITIEINRLDGIPVGTYTTGGSLTSVDIAMKNGLWAVAGSTDGKFNVLQQKTTPHPPVCIRIRIGFGKSVTCVAMSVRGEMVVVGMRPTGPPHVKPTGGGTEGRGLTDTTDTNGSRPRSPCSRTGPLVGRKTVVIREDETSNPYTWRTGIRDGTWTDAQGKVRRVPEAVITARSINSR